MKTKILLLGPVAPAVGGIATAVAAMAASALSWKYNLRIVSNGSNRPMNKTGRLDLLNVWRACALVFRVVGALVIFRPTIVQIEMAGGLGFAKQSLCVLVSRLLGRKVIISLHCANAGMPLQEFASGDYRFLRWYCAGVLRLCHRIRVYSASWCVPFAECWGVPAWHVVAVPNCLGTDFSWASVPRRDEKRNEIRILCVGSVGERKGSFLLIAAIRKLLDAGIPVNLVLIGPEEREGGMEALRNEARRTGVDSSLQLMGLQDRSIVFQELAKADIFSLPSYREGFPYAIVEAMAIGLPVVVSRVGAVPDMVRDRETGLLVEPGSVESLANALLLLAWDPVFRQQLALQGQVFASQHFGLECIEKSFDAIYQDLVPVLPGQGGMQK